MTTFLLLLVSCQMASVLSIAIVGSINAIEQGDAGAMEAANFAVGQLNMASNSEHALVMTSLITGTKQVCSLLTQLA